jgi:hypothetical protein
MIQQNIPIIEVHKYINTCQKIIRLCNEGISEMENTLDQLKIELSNNLEFEQEQIIEDIVASNLHLEVCIVNKNMAYSGLNEFVHFLN